jgi:hypothetical protein
VAVVEAFRARGIYPKGLRSLAVGTLLWDRPAAAVQALLRPELKRLRPFADEYAYIDGRDARNPRADIFNKLRAWRAELHGAIKDFLSSLSAQDRDAVAAEMGLDLRPGYAWFEVRSLQFTRKASPAGAGLPQALISIVQERPEAVDEADSASFTFRGGCTIIVDLRSGDVDYVIQKNVRSTARLAEERAFHLASRAGLVGLYMGAVNAADPSRQLAQLHACDPELGRG